MNNAQTSIRMLSAGHCEHMVQEMRNVRSNRNPLFLDFRTATQFNAWRLPNSILVCPVPQIRHNSNADTDWKFTFEDYLATEEERQLYKESTWADVVIVDDTLPSRQGDWVWQMAGTSTGIISAFLADSRAPKTCGRLYWLEGGMQYLLRLFPQLPAQVPPRRVEAGPSVRGRPRNNQAPNDVQNLNQNFYLARVGDSRPNNTQMRQPRAVEQRRAESNGETAVEQIRIGTLNP